MIIDRQNLFNPLGDGLTAATNGGQQNIRAAGTYISTDQIDLSQIAVASGVTWDWGVGPEPILIVRVGEAFVGGTNITINLLSADVAPGMTGNPTTHFSQVVATAGLTANTEIVRTKLPSGAYRRFLAVQYVSTGTYTAGGIDAMLVIGIQRNLPMPSGFRLPAAV
jgi:hypothetical protein